jgi:hypothetical protein
MPSLRFITLTRGQKGNNHSDGFSFFQKMKRERMFVSLRPLKEWRLNCLPARDRDGSKDSRPRICMGVVCSWSYVRFLWPIPHSTELVSPKVYKEISRYHFLCKGNRLIVINKVYQSWQYTWELVNDVQGKHTINNMFHELLGENSLRACSLEVLKFNKYCNTFVLFDKKIQF